MKATSRSKQLGKNGRGRCNERGTNVGSRKSAPPVEKRKSGSTIDSATFARQRSSEFFRDVLATVRGPLLVLDQELRVFSANDPFLKTFQVSSEETVHRYIYDLGNGQWDIPRLRELLGKVLFEDASVTEFEIDHEFENIGRRIMVLNANIIVTPNAIEPMLLLAIEDITERKRAEELLRISEERFRTIADNMSQLAWTCDQLGNVNWYNRRWLDYTGMTFQEMAGWDWSKVQHPEHLERVIEGVKASRDTGETWEDTFPLRSKDGTYRWFLSRAIPIRDTAGNVVQWFGTNTDITDNRLAEAALIKSEKVSAAGRLAFVLAHEINNPLQAVTNLMSLLEQAQELHDSTRMYLTMANTELARISHLTRQSLAFYRDSTSPGPVNLEELLDSVIDLYSSQFEKQGITVNKRYRSNITINSYPGEIRQIVTTLVVNAMEAMPEGGKILVHVHQDGTLKSKSHGARVVIADTGTGISKENMPRIFEAFFTTKEQQGTGLGLWVAQGIVSRLGGFIKVRSSVLPRKSGTSFSIFLPHELSNKNMLNPIR